MTDSSIDEADAAVINDEASDESLEAAAMAINLAGRSIGFFCTGLTECPSPNPV